MSAVYYDPVSQDEASAAGSTLLTIADPDGIRSGYSSDTKSRLTRPRWWWHATGHVALLMISWSMLFAAWKTYHAQCAYVLSAYSPVLSAVEYKDTVLNSILDSPSEYRGPPSASIDKAWSRTQLNAVSSGKAIRVQPTELAKIGQSMRPSLVSYQAEDGGGIHAGIEAGYQLHCLDILRRDSYVDYYGPLDTFHAEYPGYQRVYVDHCIEVLRQTLMCNADVGLLTFDWVEGFDTPFPNFKTQHKCRDFEKIYQWYEETMFDVSKASAIRAGNLTAEDVGAASAVDSKYQQRVEHK